MIGLCQVLLYSIITKLAGFEYTKYFKKDKIRENFPVHIVRAKNVRMGTFVENENEAITYELSETLNRSALTKDCLLMTFIGAGIGDTCIYHSEKRHHLAPNVAKIEPQTDGIYLRYYMFFLMSPEGQKSVDKIKKSTAQPSLSMETIRSIRIALPPLAEQKRIVAKIEEILPYIDRYEKAWSRLEDLNKRFPEDMQKSVLQMAIQGKLVEQRPEEGTAEEILYKLHIYTESLKPSKSDLDLSDMDFDIPNNWSWAKINQLFNFIDYRGKTPNKVSEGVFLITASNIKTGYMDYTRKEYISDEEYETRKSRGITHKGNLLFTTEAPLGNAALCDLNVCSCGQRIITFQEYEKNTLIPKLYMYFILSPSFQKQLLSNCTGTTAKGIKAEKLKHLILPLPPLAEQKRIVEKLEEILPLCEKLE